MSWQIVFTPRSKKELQRLPALDRVQVYRALKRLSEDEPNLDIKKLWGDPPQWRLRVGKWRVIYTRSEAPNQDGQVVPTITVLNVFDRKDGY